MTTYITAVHMTPITANDHEHISHVQWSQPGRSGTDSREEMIAFIDKGNAVYVQGPPDAKVGVVAGSPRFLRTHADGYWTNNLLSLPRF
jgi:hypothetical protein